MNNKYWVILLLVALTASASLAHAQTFSRASDGNSTNRISSVVVSDKKLTVVDTGPILDRDGGSKSHGAEPTSLLLLGIGLGVMKLRNRDKES